MKSIIRAIVFSVLVLTSHAATWVIHGAKDNTAYVSISSNQVCISDGTTTVCGTEWAAGATFDYWLDQQTPEFADSGCDSEVLQIDGSYLSYGRVSGWQESYTLTIGEVLPNAPIVSTEEFIVTYVGVGGPNWESWKEGTLPAISGEYWVDFAPDSTCRISTTQPADFGKWAWDGSINPSWAEPVAPLQRGKHLALGHGK